MVQSYPSAPSSGPQTSGLAIASLAGGILGFTIVPIIGGIVGLILGYIAKKQIRESGGTLTGEGLATAGIIMGWIQVAIPVCAVCVILILAILGPAIGNVFENISSNLY